MIAHHTPPGRMSYAIYYTILYATGTYITADFLDEGQGADERPAMRQGKAVVEINVEITVAFESHPFGDTRVGNLPQGVWWLIVFYSCLLLTVARLTYPKTWPYLLSYQCRTPSISVLRNGCLLVAQPGFLLGQGWISYSRMDFILTFPSRTHRRILLLCNA